MSNKGAIGADSTVFASQTSQAFSFSIYKISFKFKSLSKTHWNTKS